jgi:hypothetical protein
MAGAGDRKKLREPFNDAEDEGLKEEGQFHRPGSE